MPTYEYTCTKCGEHLEVVQSFRDEALTVCPACGGPLRKVFGSIGVVFKGSGFYKTDSRPAGTSRDSSGSDAKTTDTSSASPAKSGEGSSATGGSTSTSDSGPKDAKKKGDTASTASKAAAAS